MRWCLLLLVVGLAPLAGCHLAETAAFNAVNEPAMLLDEKHVTHQLRAEAKQLVRDLRKQQAMSADFEDGFVDGYADALERGGEPLPPAVPPTKYRRGRFLNPDGHARVYDYFAGFQQGATCAASSGKRQFLTVPVLLADPPAEQSPPVVQVPKEECGPNAPTPKGQPPAGSAMAAPPARKPAEAVKPAATEKQAEVPTLPNTTELASPKRPLLRTPLVPPPPPGPEAPSPTLPQVATLTPPAGPTPEGVVPPVAEPPFVVPPQPEPRK